MLVVSTMLWCSRKNCHISGDTVGCCRCSRTQLHNHRRHSKVCPQTVDYLQQPDSSAIQLSAQLDHTKYEGRAPWAELAVPIGGVIRD
jgi:hypothetical protein